MNRDIQAFGRVDMDGKLKIVHRKIFDEDLKLLRGKNVDISIKQSRTVRSSQQNRLWWLYMKILGNETGYTKDEIHDICKFKFLRVKRYICNLNDSGRRVILAQDGEEYVDISNNRRYLREEFEILEETWNLGSTAKLTKDEFGELVDKMVPWAKEMFNVTLPMPEEQTKMDV